MTIIDEVQQNQSCVEQSIIFEALKYISDKFITKSQIFHFDETLTVMNFCKSKYDKQI